MSRQFTFFGFLKLTRFWNLLIIALAQYFAAHFLIGYPVITDIHLFTLAMSTVIIAAGGYIINDYYDIKIDLINKPDRVVIGKEVARRYALLFHSLLCMAGVALGFLLNWKIGVINFFCAFLLWWYSNDLVNVMYHIHHPIVTIYALFAFAMTLVREIVKDAEDLKGDNTFGCKSLPIIWGLRRTKFFIYFLLLLFFISVIEINQFFAQLPMYYFFTFLFVPLVLLVVWLVRADTTKDFHRISQWCKVIMLLGISSMIFI